MSEAGSKIQITISARAGKQRLGHKPIETFIKFEDGGTSPSGKTKIWCVVNTMGELYDECGYIRWHGPWRKYVFQSPDDSFFDWDFLRLVADFCETKTAEHMAKTKQS